jgi:hypothetical protein
MTDPSSSTPASPPTEQPALAHLLEVAAKIVRREYLPTLESCKNIGQARTLIARYGATHAALGMELKSIFDKLASVRAASTGTAADFLKRGRWTHGALKAIRDEVCGCETMPRFITNPDCLDMVDNSALRWEVDWLTRQEFESIFPAPPVASQKGKEEE